MRIIAIIGVTFLAVLSAVFACFMGLAAAIAGDETSGMLWIGSAMFAILYAAFMVASLGGPETKNDDRDQNDTAF